MRRTLAGPGSSHGTYQPKTDPGKALPSGNNGSPSEFYSKSNKDQQDK